MWTKYDTDGNGILDKEEAKPFIDHVARIIEADRAKNYNKNKFLELFEQFDED